MQIRKSLLNWKERRALWPWRSGFLGSSGSWAPLPGTDLDGSGKIPGRKSCVSSPGGTWKQQGASKPQSTVRSHRGSASPACKAAPLKAASGRKACLSPSPSIRGRWKQDTKPCPPQVTHRPGGKMEHATQKQEDMTIPEAKRSLWGQWPFSIPVCSHGLYFVWRWRKGTASALVSLLIRTPILLIRAPPF